MVPVTRLELVRYCYHWIFLPLYVTIAIIIKSWLTDWLPHLTQYYRITCLSTIYYYVVVWTMSLPCIQFVYLGSWCMASTHLEKNCEPATSYTYPFIWSISATQLLFFSFSTAFCVRLRRLANFYSEDFSSGTLYEKLRSPILNIGEHIKVQGVCHSTTPAYKQGSFFWITI